jgi:transcriptional regulator with XRE-family HTH domain
MTNIKHRVKILREDHGWSQEALARRIGTTATQINRLEKGKRKLSAEWLMSLCAAFDVTVDKIIVDMPIPNINIAKCDPAMLESIVGWLLLACDKFKIKPDPKEIGKWTSYAFNDVVEKDLSYAEARALAFHLAEIGKVDKKKKPGKNKKTQKSS